MIGFKAKAIAIMGSVLLAVLALWARAMKRAGRKELQDEMQDAYNATTKDLHHAKTKRPTERNAVLDSLHGYAERGDGGSDT